MAADFSDFRGFKLRYHHCRWCRRSDDRSFYRSTLRRNHVHRGSHAVIRRHDFSRNCTRKSFLSVSAFPSTGEHFSYLIWYLFRYFSGKLDSGSCRSCRCLSRFLSENSSHPRLPVIIIAIAAGKFGRMLPFLLSQMAISFLIICIKHIKVKRNPVFSQIFLYLPKIYQERNDFMKQLSPGTKTYKENQKRYEKYVNSITPSHSLPLNMIKAFLTGGLICAFGQLILNTAMTIGARPRNRRQLVLFTSDPDQCHLNRIKSLFQNRQIWRCRRTCSHYRFRQLCCSFRDRIPCRGTGFRHRLQNIYHCRSCHSLWDPKFLDSRTHLFYCSSYGGDVMSVGKQTGKASISFTDPVYIQSAASVVGSKEGNGPLKEYFDMSAKIPCSG